MSALDFDVAIAGGGVVGATLAGALGQRGFRVALIEARVPPRPADNTGPDLRVYALSRASENIFTALGAWEAMRRLGAGAFRCMHVWDAGGAGSIHFDCAEIGEPHLGHIVEQRNILLGLYNRLRDQPAVTLLSPARVTGLERRDGHVGLALEDGRRINARLAVAADGRDSPLRAMAGLAVEVRDYRQQALVTTVRTAQPHQETAWQRFLSTGPLAFLPMHDGASSIVWSTGLDEAEHLLALDPAAFRDALAAAFDHRLGAVIESLPPVAFPLSRLRAPQYVADRVVLVGDAAHGIHPLAGQGVNLGLLDAAALADVLGDAHRRGRDFGRHEVLRRYERWRKGDNLVTQQAMDGFHALFGSRLQPLPALRNLGLDIADTVSPFKHCIMRQAMGLGGELPALASRRPA